MAAMAKMKAAYRNNGGASSMSMKMKAAKAVNGV
jgi:hypothetical protein